MNIFDLRGPEFLEFYLTLLVIAFPAAVLLRWLLRGPGGAPPERALKMDPFEIAYLAGGKEMAVNAALASLLQRETVKLDLTSGVLSMGTAVAVPLQPLEQRVCDAVI